MDRWIFSTAAKFCVYLKIFFVLLLLLEKAFYFPFFFYLSLSTIKILEVVDFPFLNAQKLDTITTIFETEIVSFFSESHMATTVLYCFYFENCLKVYNTNYITTEHICSYPLVIFGTQDHFGEDFDTIHCLTLSLTYFTNAAAIILFWKANFTRSFTPIFTTS